MSGKVHLVCHLIHLTYVRSALWVGTDTTSYQLSQLRERESVYEREKISAFTDIFRVDVSREGRVVTLFDLLAQRVEVHLVPIEWRLESCHLAH